MHSPHSEVRTTRRLGELLAQPVHVDWEAMRIYPAGGYVCVDFVSPPELARPYFSLYAAVHPMALALLAVEDAFALAPTDGAQRAALQLVHEALAQARGVHEDASACP